VSAASYTTAAAEHVTSSQVQVSSIPVGQLINVSAAGTFNVISADSLQVKIIAFHSDRSRAITRCNISVPTVFCFPIFFPPTLITVVFAIPLKFPHMQSLFSISVRRANGTAVDVSVTFDNVNFTPISWGREGYRKFSMGVKKKIW
jgi:hypothetical protein